jgi:hypothetical protein
VSPAVTAEGGTLPASPLDTVAAFEFVAIHDDSPPTRVAEDDDVTSIIAPSPPIIVATPPHVVAAPPGVAAAAPAVVAITPDNVAFTPPIIATTPPVIIVIVVIIVVIVVPIPPIVVTPLDAPISPIFIIVLPPLDAPGATRIIIVAAIAALRRELGRDCQSDDCQEEPDQRPHGGCTSLNMVRVGRGHRASLRKATRGIVVSSAARTSSSA